MAINPIKDETLNLFPDNTDGDITASDMRQYVENVWKDKERKINKYPTLSEAFQHPELYQLDIFLITKEPIQSKNGIYVALINQPNNENEIVQVANLTKNEVLEVQTYDEMVSLNVNKGDICTVLENYQTYIFDGSTWKEFLSDISIQNSIKDDLISETTLWSSKKISEFISTIAVEHTHPITDIENLENTLNNIYQSLSNKIDVLNPKAKGVFSLIQNENGDNTIEISNVSNISASPTRTTTIDDTSLSITNNNVEFKITNEILPSFKITSNGVTSSVMDFVAGEAPKTTFSPIRDIDLTNKRYVDDKIAQLPDITNFATVQYVDQQDDKRVSKSGDIITGGLKIEYGNIFSGITFRNTDLNNPLLEWMIGHTDNNQLGLLRYENSTITNSGIVINTDANTLELSDTITYDGKELVTVEYVDIENNKQNLVISNKVNRNGDIMTGSLTARGLTTSNNSYLKIQEYNISNRPDREYVNFQYNPSGITTRSITDPTLVIFPADENNNKPTNLNFQLATYSNNNYELVWTSGNDGIDSGLDADMVDGLQPSEFPVSNPTLSELNKKLDKVGGTITGDLQINGFLTVDNEIFGGNTYVSGLSVSNISNLGTTNIDGLTTITNGNDLSVTGKTTSSDLEIQNEALFHSHITVGESLSTNPKINFTDTNSKNPPSINYNKTKKEFTIDNDLYLDSMIYHENNLDVFFKNEFIDFANGPTDQGKPIVLNMNGKIDPSMLDVSVFYYVGSFTPTPALEYPDSTNETFGAFWDIVGVDPNGYTFTGGDLAGKTIKNGDFLVWAVGGWSIMVSEMNPTMYYKLDGTSAITGPFAGGGQQLKNIADGTDSQDAVTVNQISSFSSHFYAVDGSNPLITHFQAGGYQLKNVSDGIADSDGATMKQVNVKVNIDGSSIILGNQVFGDGNVGGNIILRASSNSDAPVIEFQRRDGRKFADTLMRDLKDYVISLYDPDDGTPDSPNAVYKFERSGNLSAPMVSVINSLNLTESSVIPKISFKRSDSSRKSEITSEVANLLFNLYSDDGNTLETSMELKRDGDLLVNGHSVFTENNFDPDTKEDSLGNPSDNGQILSSDITGNRSWIYPTKTFLDLEDTPTDYTGKGGQLLGVKQTEDGLEFGDAGPNLTRHIFHGDGVTNEFVIPGGYLPGNVDVYLNRTRMINAPEIQGGDIDATNGTSIIFYNTPPRDIRIEVAAYVKDSFMIMPNATENTVGGMRVRIDSASNTVYITTDGTNP